MLLTHPLAGIAFGLSIGLASAATANLPVSAQTNEVDSDWSAIYYGKSFQDSLLVGNDGSAATGGFATFSLADMHEVARRTPGRTKAAGVMYDVGQKGKDLIVSIAATDSVIRVYDIDGTEIPSARKDALGDWDALCTWRSQSGGHYFYLIGKKQAWQFLVRERMLRLKSSRLVS